VRVMDPLAELSGFPAARGALIVPTRTSPPKLRRFAPYALAESARSCFGLEQGRGSARDTVIAGSEATRALRAHVANAAIGGMRSAAERSRKASVASKRNSSSSFRVRSRLLGPSEALVADESSTVVEKNGRLPAGGGSVFRQRAFAAFGFKLERAYARALAV
jgi:hypothetical protein